MVGVGDVDVEVSGSLGGAVAVQDSKVHALHFTTRTDPSQHLLRLLHGLNGPSHTATATLGTTPAAHERVTSNDAPLVGHFLSVITVINFDHGVEYDTFFKKIKP